MRLLATDVERIAKHPSIPAETLVEAVTALRPGNPDNDLPTEQ